jgi:hypothetical protein
MPFHGGLFSLRYVLEAFKRFQVLLKTQTAVHCNLAKFCSVRQKNLYCILRNSGGTQKAQNTQKHAETRMLFDGNDRTAAKALFPY